MQSPHLLMLFNLITTLVSLAKVKLCHFPLTHQKESNHLTWYKVMYGVWHQLFLMLITNILSLLLTTIIDSHGFIFYALKENFSKTFTWIYSNQFSTNIKILRFDNRVRTCFTCFRNTYNTHGIKTKKILRSNNKVSTHLTCFMNTYNTHGIISQRSCP